MKLPLLCALAAAAVTACAAAPDQAAVSDASLDAYANVARRVYASERSGSPVRASLRRIARDAAAMRGNRAELLRQLFLPGYHVVRLRVVRGRPGHVAASSSALAKASLPASGTAAVAGRTYRVTSFGEPGFAGERLRVWILAPHL